MSESPDLRPRAEIELDFPLSIANAEVSVLQMRRPTVRDELKFSESKKSQARKAVDLFADLCELTPAEIEALDAGDFAKLERQYLDFRGTAGNPTPGN